MTRKTAQQKIDTEEILEEFKLLAEKLKFLGVTKGELEKILGEEYEERCENQ